MAYAEKYYHTYCDHHGNEFRVSLRVLDYAGAATEVECGPEQFRIESEDTSEIKLGGVFPTRAVAFFISDVGFDLEELYTGDETSYQLVRLKNGEIDWIGNVVPDGFSEDNFDDERSILTVKATDNLPTLKGKQFVDENGDNFGDEDGEYMQSFLWVIKECLKKTGFLLPIWTLVDLKTLIQYELNEVTEGMIYWSENELRSNAPVTPERANDLITIIRQGLKIKVTSGDYDGTIYTVTSTSSLYVSSTQRIISVKVSETVNSDVEFNTFEVYNDGTPPNLVLARKGHFNDFAPSEVGIFKEGVNFDFLKVGDIVKISESSLNNGTYTVTGFENSVPPDAPYIRIQLDPQVPSPPLHENVILEIISVDTDNPDPLLTRHNIRTWINDSNIEGKTYYEARGGAMMAWDVLDAIARQFGAKIQQNNGHWEVKRWNADKIDDGQYQWFVYNSEGVEIGREDFGGDITLPCVPTNTQYRLYGTSRSMDRVLKYAIVNYRYKYNQQGDTLQNLVVNGNFEGEFNPYPTGWNKVKVDSVTGVPDMTLEKITNGLPAGLTEGIRIKNHLDTRTLDNLTVLSNTAVNRGDNLIIQWYERVNGITGTALSDAYCGVYSLAIYESLEHAYSTSLPYSRSTGRSGSRSDTGEIYYAANEGIVRGLGSVPAAPAPVRARFKARWRNATEGEDRGQAHNRLITPYALHRTGGEYGRWRLIEIEIEEIPINGFLKFEVLGAAWDKLIFSIFNPSQANIPVFAPAGGNTGSGPSDTAYERAYRTFFAPSKGVTMDVTGVFIGKLIDPGNEAVPQIDPFMYPDYQAQLSRKYSDTIPEIEVLTGDDYGQYAEDRISGMWWNGQRTTMWDTWDNRFGWSRQGLVLAKSVMEMYWKPTRLLDCEISAPDLHWSSRIQFEEMPGKRFVILRGAIGGPYSTFRGTLTEIHDAADELLPPGGNDGGNTVLPDWQPKGITRCVRDDDGLNTGEVETVEVDTNQASPTFGQERWVDAGEDTDSCPIGEPIDIYWGASADFPVDPETLEHFPYTKEGDSYTVAFDNDGTGKHLVFLHRSTLGTVQSIVYPGTSWNAYGDLPSWEYLADMTINGYTYKVMRQIYPSGTFTGMGLTFNIQ